MIFDITDKFGHKLVHGDVVRLLDKYVGVIEKGPYSPEIELETFEMRDALCEELHTYEEDPNITFIDRNISFDCLDKIIAPHFGSVENCLEWVCTIKYDNYLSKHYMDMSIEEYGMYEDKGEE